MSVKPTKVFPNCGVVVWQTAEEDGAPELPVLRWREKHDVLGFGDVMTGGFYFLKRPVSAFNRPLPPSSICGGWNPAHRLTDSLRSLDHVQNHAQMRGCVTG
jgi:hypothetical protein